MPLKLQWRDPTAVLRSGQCGAKVPTVGGHSIEVTFLQGFTGGCPTPMMTVLSFWMFLVYRSELGLNGEGGFPVQAHVEAIGVDMTIAQ